MIQSVEKVSQSEYWWQKYLGMLKISRKYIDFNQSRLIYCILSLEISFLIHKLHYNIFSGNVFILTFKLYLYSNILRPFLGFSLFDLSIC